MKRIAILISGRYYFSDYNNHFFNDYKIKQNDIQFETFLHIWSEETHNSGEIYVNDLNKINNYYKPTKQIVENFNLIMNNNKLESNFDIMCYQRKMVFDLIDHLDYDGYIHIRPDVLYINNINFNNELLNDTIYCYQCPNFAYDICSNFCDWFILGNYYTIKKINNIKYTHNIGLSNESNYKINFINNNIEINILGIVGSDIELKWV